MFFRMPKSVHECSLSSDMTLCPPVLRQAACYNSVKPPPPAWTLCSFLELFLLTPCSEMSVSAVGLWQHCLTGLCSSRHINYGTATVPPTSRDDKWWITSVNKMLWIIQNRDECKLDGMILNQLQWFLCWKIVQAVVITKRTSGWKSYGNNKG